MLSPILAFSLLGMALGVGEYVFVYRSECRMCFTKGAPLEPKCGSLTSLISTTENGFCYVSDPEDKVKQPFLTFDVGPRPGYELTDLLERRGLEPAKTKKLVTKFFCPANFIRSGINCYLKMEDQDNWETAEKKCQEKGNSYHLPTFHSDNEVKEFFEIVKDTNSRFWTGQHFKGDLWTNVDSSPVDYYRWLASVSFDSSREAVVLSRDAFKSGEGSSYSYFTTASKSESYSYYCQTEVDDPHKPIKIEDPTTAATDTPTTPTTPSTPAPPTAPPPECNATHCGEYTIEDIKCGTSPILGARVDITSAGQQVHYWDADLKCYFLLTQSANAQGVGNAGSILGPGPDEKVKKVCTKLVKLYWHQKESTKKSNPVTYITVGENPPNYVLQKKNKYMGLCSPKKDYCGATVALKKVYRDDNNDVFYLTDDDEGDLSAAAQQVANKQLKGSGSVRTEDVCFVWNTYANMK